MILSGRELDIMNVLWDQGSATVSEVLDALADDLAYTTVLTVLQRLEEKGHVGHEAEGKAHRYLPLLDRGTVRESAVQRMTSTLFGDSPALLMVHLLDRKGLTDEELRDLRALVDERLGHEGPGEEGDA